MPTNILRNRTTPARKPQREGAGLAKRRQVVITAGRVTIRAELRDTETADRIWQALPIYSTAETWGGSIHFETPVETGREPGAPATADIGDLHFWTEDDRVIIVFGRTPISRGLERLLPKPCNVWAKALDDVTRLKTVTPGEKVSIVAAG